MILSSLELESFRNYITENINFNNYKNIISGKNAQGKTNLLEAIYLTCISKSFKTRIEKEMICFGENGFTLKGNFKSDNGSDKTVFIQYDENHGKQLFVNRKKINTLSDFIGQFPIIITSPEEYNLTSGAPNERRRFIDILLSQISIKYIHNLQKFYRITKQRNKILCERKFSDQQLKKILEPWDESLIEAGSLIIFERAKFTEKFNTLLLDVYQNLNISNETIDFTYKSNLQFFNTDTIKEDYQKKLHNIFHLELKQGKSLLGPHRDDFIFQINGKNLRTFGSRGQHKTVLISLTIAEFTIIKEKLNETPIILIDDLYSEIDKNREQRIMDVLQNLGQIFITTTLELDEIKNLVLTNNFKYFYLEDGKIREV